MKKYYADKTGIGILFVIMFLAVIILITLSLVFLSFLPILMWIAVGLFAAAFFAVVIVWLPLYFKNLCYFITDKEIVANTGVFFKNKRIMKLSAVQYFTCVTTPFSEKTGFNFVVLNALGGNIILLLLSHGDMDEIAQTLSLVIKQKKEG